jgi:uncharacterized protein
MKDPTQHDTQPAPDINHYDTHSEWPEKGLDIASAVANGWHQVPIREYIIKLSSRCNIACDYCYVYTMADQSWRKRPVLMSRATIEQASRRIAEHARMRSLPHVRVVLHGGEPLLGGPGLIDYAASVIRRDLSADISLEISIQTNGALLDERIMRVMHAHRIRIGLSLDGAAEHHNRHRKLVNGSGSHPMALHALKLLNKSEHRELFAGLLCTIDLNNDPNEVYKALASFTPPMLDFLLPHGNWSSPPPMRDSGQDSPYARWLSVIFDRWCSDIHGEIRIRLFEEIIRLLLGFGSRSDQVGLSPAAFLVIDTDGSLQQTDALKAAYAGAPETGLNVCDHAVDDALSHPAVIARQLGLMALADECRRCSVVAVCGGGHYPHRYRRGSGFRNPSVYCSDLRALIDHIARRLSAGLTS